MTLDELCKRAGPGGLVILFLGCLWPFEDTELRPSSPSFALHDDSCATARLVADAAIVALRETDSEAAREAKRRAIVRRQAGRAWNRGLTMSVGEEPAEPPLPGPNMPPLEAP